jgi:transcriptional regulator with XRE-family HTH domain
MGSAARRRPVRLAEKLSEARRKLGLSQNEMIRRMGMEDELTQAHVSLFESGSRVPSLPVLLAYAEAANVYLEVLVKDDLDLPDVIPARSKSEGIRRSSQGAKSLKRRR